MKRLQHGYYEKAFAHIYIEKEIKDHPRARRILAKFPKATVIEIAHYKDVFCRRRQDVTKQQEAPSLILAAKQGTLCYPGAAVCQSFGEEHFFYTSCVMNCLYDCEYCYLRGMYPSGHLVIFVNLEDIFAEVERMLQTQELYLCVSYDTDLMALEDITGFVKEWVNFTACHDKLRIEIRTKCGRMDLYKQLTAVPGVIFAFTMSPDAVIGRYERRTPPLEQRIACAANALEKGFSVRLCFDPMLYFADWKEHYEAMWEQIASGLDLSKLCDVSIGSFRIGKDYLKRMRRTLPGSAVVQFPFENTEGVCHYPKDLMQAMEGFLWEEVRKSIPEEKIYCWAE